MVKYSNVDYIYSSLSDPIRREILLKISAGSLNLQEVAQKNNISLPAVSKHLKVLEKTQLITRQKKGREYQFSLTEIAKFWLKQFQNLEQFLKRG
jgi:predicted transcriptional regulator